MALESPRLAPTVTAAVDRATSRLGAAGYSGHSAYLTSPTFGGLSWLAHSTLQTGLPITDQVRYNAVIASTRLTLASAFRSAGGAPPSSALPTSPTSRRSPRSIATTPVQTVRAWATADQDSGMRQCRTSSRWPPLRSGSSALRAAR